MRLMAIFLLLATFAVPADAQQSAPQPRSEPGRAFSNSSQPLPANTAVQVRALDNSPSNQRLLRVVRDAVRGRLPVVDSSAIVVTFETEVNSIAVRQRDRRDVDEQGHYYQFSLPLRPAPGAAPAPAPRNDAASPNATSQFVLSITIDDRRSGQRLWEGRAYYAGQVEDEEPAFQAMIRILVEQIGRTVRVRAFRL